jgi:hypothetical protein
MSQIIKSTELTGAKRKPPKLKSSDRSISVMVENYGQQQLSAMVLERIPDHPSVIHAHNLIKQKSVEDYRSAPIFYTNQSSTGHQQQYSHSSTSLQPSVNKRHLRRYDTLDSSTPSLYYVKKTQSLHSNELADDLITVPIAKQNVDFMHSSDSNPLPSDIEIDDEMDDVNNVRRNCHMHRSFNDPHNQRRPISRHASVQYHSFNDDIHDNRNMDGRKFSSANISLENEIYRNLSISNSRNLEVAAASTNRAIIQQRNPQRQTQRQSSFSLDHSRQPQPHNSRRSLRIPPTNSYLITTSPIHLDRKSIEELKPKPQQLLPQPQQQQTALPHQSPIYDVKKTYSLRYKQGKSSRDNFRTKKSKSFITELDSEYDESSGAVGGVNTANRKLKRSDYSSFSHDDFDQIRRSTTNRKLSSNKIFDENIGSVDKLKTPKVPFDDDVDGLGNIEYDLVLKPYRESRSRAKGSSSRKTRKSQHSSKIENEDSESVKKRKRIVCFICVIFIGLMIFSVLAVVITLTHSTSSLVQNQTRQIYTFARGSPIHYNGN